MEMESREATCLHCGRVNEITGFAEAFAFLCRYCGEGVNPSKVLPKPPLGPHHQTASSQGLMPLYPLVEPHAKPGVERRHDGIRHCASHPWIMRRAARNS
jgi:hypothetical protein